VKTAAIASLLALPLLACSQKPKEQPKTEPLGAVGASSAAGATSAAAEVKPQCGGKLNVLLLTVDAWRSDETPWKNYPRPVTPNLMRFAEQAVTYPNSFPTSSYTAKSTASWISGKYPSSLYRNGVFFVSYAPSNWFITEPMQAAGIATVGWQAHMYFGRGKGFDKGFATWQIVPGITFDAQTDNHITGEKSTKLGIELLSKPEITGKQFFAWTHFLDPHDVYNKHEECPDWGNKARDKYDSELCYADKWLGKLLEFAEAQPWWNNTAVIITSDHGEAFGEHGQFRHAFELWDVLTRVPMIIHVPGAKPQRIDLKRSHIDLAPTILDLMGLAIPPELPGKSLVPELCGVAPAADRDPILLDLPEDSNNPQRQAIISGNYKLIVAGPKGYIKQLYDLSKDPGELKDLAKEQPEKLAEMVALFEKSWGAIPQVKPFGGNKLASGALATGPMGPAQDPNLQSKK